MANTWITDLRDFLDDGGALVAGPAGRTAAYWTQLVAAATVRADLGWSRSATRCRRRPGGTRCGGYVQVVRHDDPLAVEWQCPDCGDRGVVSGWEGSAWDLRAAARVESPEPAVEVQLSDDAYGALLRCPAIILGAPFVVARAVARAERVVVAGSSTELDDVQRRIAFVANRTTNRRWQRDLDGVYERIADALGRGGEEPVADAADDGGPRH